MLKTVYVEHDDMTQYYKLCSIPLRGEEFRKVLHVVMLYIGVFHTKQTWDSSTSPLCVLTSAG